MRAIGYIRVSTEEQARDGVSLDAQRARVRAFADLHGLDLVELVEDPGESAKSLARPGLAHCLARLDDRSADGLVVAKLDRLTRSLADWAVLMDRYFGPTAGRQLWSLGDSIDTRTAAGRMTLNLIMTIAQWEREAIAERTREGLWVKRRRGDRLGTVPVGCRVVDNGRRSKSGGPVGLAEDPAELAAVARMRELAAEGIGARPIARILAGEGRAGRSGRPWNESTIRRILAAGVHDGR